MGSDRTKGDPERVLRFLEAATGTIAALSLPRDSSVLDRATSRSAASRAGARHLDAWNLDRLRRSSLPPAMLGAAEEPGPNIPPLPALGPVEPADEGDALSLVGRSAQIVHATAADLVREMADRFALGDFTGALRAAELLLGQDPHHHLAEHYARASRDKLEAIYSSRLCTGGSIPELAVDESELRWLGLNSQIGAVLARVDGVTPVNELVASCGVPKLEALRALVELLRSRVIRLV